MDTLTIHTVNGWRVLEPTGRFSGFGMNRFQDISVINPDDPYGPPLYRGPAWAANRYLSEGVYTYEMEEDD